MLNREDTTSKKGVSKQTPFFLLLGAGFLVWVSLFLYFLNGQKPLVDDASAYLGHVQFYIENISRGVYPMWDPFRDLGTVSEFYMRRIGEFNPFFWLIVPFHKLGMSFAASYGIFLAFYFALGLFGFYLLCRRIFTDVRVAFMAVLVLMFSSLAGKPFESYLLLTLVPSIWFLYYLVAFLQDPRKSFMLGMTFCFMLVAITYIPFYFLTVLLAGAITFGAVYFGVLKTIFNRCASFVSLHRRFSILCALALLLSLTPGILWNLEAAKAEAMAPDRFVGSLSSNTATLPIVRVNEGGIVAPLLFERLLVDLDQLRLGDFYIPVFVFLSLGVGLFTLASRRLLFLFCWGFIIYVIGSADATGVHKFLYDHVFFFKYFRNLQFFTWLALLPIFIFFVAEVFSILLDSTKRSLDKRLYLYYALLVHAAAIVFFLRQEGVILSTYLSIALSLAFFVGLFLERFSIRVLACLMFLSIVVQPVETYLHLNHAYEQRPSSNEYNKGLSLKLPVRDLSKEALSTGYVMYNPYFALKWAHVLKKLNKDALGQYTTAKFLLYDRLELMDDAKLNIRQVESAFAGFENIAFVAAVQGIHTHLSNNIDAASQAQVITEHSPELKLLHFDTNGWSVKTSLAADKFLVYTGTYHSGWKVSIDGKRVELLRTNIAFQGVWVPAGVHVVTARFGDDWRYVYGYFMIGLFWSVLIALVALTVKRL